MWSVFRLLLVVHRKFALGTAVPLELVAGGGPPPWAKRCPEQYSQPVRFKEGSVGSTKSTVTTWPVGTSLWRRNNLVSHQHTNVHAATRKIYPMNPNKSVGYPYR